MMVDRVSDILIRLGFEVQVTAYAHLIENASLHYLQTSSFPANTAFSILKYFPDLFVMHKAIRPLYGTFFIVLLSKGKVLSKSAVDVYTNYFPSNILVASENDPKTVLAKWLYKVDQPMPLELLIKQDIACHQK